MQKPQRFSDILDWSMPTPLYLDHLNECIDEDVGDVLKLRLPVFDRGYGSVVGQQQVSEESQTPRQRR